MSARSTSASGERYDPTREYYDTSGFDEVPQKASAGRSKTQKTKAQKELAEKNQTLDAKMVKTWENLKKQTPPSAQQQVSENAHSLPARLLRQEAVRRFFPDASLAEPPSRPPELSTASDTRKPTTPLEERLAKRGGRPPFVRLPTTPPPSQKQVTAASASPSPSPAPKPAESSSLVVASPLSAKPDASSSSREISPNLYASWRNFTERISDFGSGFPIPPRTIQEDRQELQRMVADLESVNRGMMEYTQEGIACFRSDLYVLQRYYNNDLQEYCPSQDLKDKYKAFLNKWEEIDKNPSLLPSRSPAAPPPPAKQEMTQEQFEKEVAEYARFPMEKLQQQLIQAKYTDPTLCRIIECAISEKKAKAQGEEDLFGVQDW